MPEIVDGKKIAAKINASVREKIIELSPRVGRAPRLVSITSGTSGDSEIYVNMQKKAAESVGINFDAKHYKGTVTEDILHEEINKLNRDSSVTAVIVQKPLPEGVEHDKVTSFILPEKDAEGIHPYNLGKIFRREAEIVPCTPGAIMKIFRTYEVDLYGKEVVIIGHSAIVGKPLSLMMINETATTTVCHIGTAEKGDIKEHARKADVLVVAVGKPEMIKADWVKDGVVIIDVGINRVGGNIVGDVDFKGVSGKASLITPVPGGVGPITVSILMRNVFRAYRSQNVRP